MDYNISVGKQIKKLRKDKKYTLKQLSDESGLSIGFLSQLERGMSTIAIDSLAIIAKILGTDLSSFFKQKVRSLEDVVIRSYTRECTPVNEQIIQYMLSNKVNDFTMLPRLFELLPFSSLEKLDPGLYHHDGEEFIFVLEGVLTIFYQNVQHTLYPGDSIQIHSIFDHNWINLTNRVTKFISVNTPNPLQSSDVLPFH